MIIVAAGTPGISEWDGSHSTETSINIIIGNGSSSMSIVRLPTSDFFAVKGFWPANFGRFVVRCQH